VLSRESSTNESLEPGLFVSVRAHFGYALLTVPEPQPPGSDAGTEAELHAIAARLSALTSEPPSELIAGELDVIRAHLRLLAADNAEVARYLGESLGLRGPPDD
jgi:hypothetical protein